MAKTNLLISLDSGLVSQIQSVLPRTPFESVEAAIADVVVDAITGSSSAWTQAISWEPNEAEEETIANPKMSDIPRDLAKRLNPIVCTCAEETMRNSGALAAFIAEALAITANEGATGADHAYLLGWAIKAALDYEAER